MRPLASLAPKLRISVEWLVLVLGLELEAAAVPLLFSCYGHRNDPLQLACKELLCEYFDLLDCVDSNFLVSHLSLAWAKAVQQANSNNNSVRNVCGILTNIVYILIQYSWVPRQYNRWLAPNGDTWYFPPSGFPRQHIILGITQP